MLAVVIHSKEDFIDALVGIRFLDIVPDAALDDFHDAVVKACIKDHQLFTEIVVGADDSHRVVWKILLLGREDGHHLVPCIAFDGYEDHVLVFHLMIQEIVIQESSRAAVGAGIAESIPRPDGFLQFRILLRIDAVPDFEFMLAAAGRAGDFRH